MSLQKTYALDIETTPQKKTLAEMSEDMQRLFRSFYQDEILAEAKTMLISESPSQEEKVIAMKQAEEVVWINKAALHPEFAKVVCFVVGVTDNSRQVRLIPFASEDEKVVLTQIIRILDQGKPDFLLVHNGKIFDIPFLVKRLRLNNMTVPDKLKIMGLKPWDMKWIIDTRDLWQMGDLRARASLDLIACSFGMPSPKNAMHGGEVYDVYYGTDENRMKIISDYCCGDVATLIKIYIAMTGQEALSSIVIG